MKHLPALQRGLTLVELLIVAALIAIVAGLTISILNPIEQVQKARDAQRKTHLEQVQNAIEKYYYDTGSYPANITFGSPFAPYMSRVPQDPNPTQFSYAYIVSTDGQAYYLYAHLERGSKDPQSCNSGGTCSNATTANCGSICNYGVTSPNVSP